MSCVCRFGKRTRLTRRPSPASPSGTSTTWPTAKWSPNEECDCEFLSEAFISRWWTLQNTPVRFQRGKCCFSGPELLEWSLLDSSTQRCLRQVFKLLLLEFWIRSIQFLDQIPPNPHVQLFLPGPRVVAVKLIHTVNDSSNRLRVAAQVADLQIQNISTSTFIHLACSSDCGSCSKPPCLERSEPTNC